jgi:GT2 family glycosyltransferase
MQLPDYSRDRLLSENLLYNSSLFRKSDWQEAGGYCSAFKHGWEDWDFWIAMTKSGISVVRIPEALLRYRIRNHSRDRSLTVWRKCQMLLLLIFRHFTCYLKSPGSLINLLKKKRRTVI